MARKRPATKCTAAPTRRPSALLDTRVVDGQESREGDTPIRRVLLLVFEHGDQRLECAGVPDRPQCHGCHAALGLPAVLQHANQGSDGPGVLELAERPRHVISIAGTPPIEDGDQGLDCPRVSDGPECCSHEAEHVGLVIFQGHQQGVHRLGIRGFHEQVCSLCPNGPVLVL